MTDAPQDFWQTLFEKPADSGRGLQMQMRLLRKGGRPFLLLPAQPRPAAATMDLYPAQTTRARAARMVLRWLLKASVAPGAEPVSVSVAAQDPFAAFLRTQAGETGQELPVVGILAGNPGSEGQRLLVLVFDALQQPVAVVKVGLTQKAKELIDKEASFLAALPAGTRAAPKLRATFQSSRLRALALDFCAGDSPRPQQEGVLPGLLESWVDPNQTVPLSQTAEWGRLMKAVSETGNLANIAAKLGSRAVQATIVHGDLTPWNIKVAPNGTWTVLDWERGELAGVPGWDWFHYVIQNAILVGRLPISALVQQVDALLASSAFKGYAARAGIAGCERGLLQAYLLYSIEVIRPSEGREATRELLQALIAGGQKS